VEEEDQEVLGLLEEGDLVAMELREVGVVEEEAFQIFQGEAVVEEEELEPLVRLEVEVVEEEELLTFLLLQEVVVEVEEELLNCYLEKEEGVED
jgi:hypothetical protein